MVVIEPLLIDEDYYARVEGREIISNLAKAAGLATMISTMRPDIDNIDEYVRNTTARAFAVVASALGKFEKTNIINYIFMTNPYVKQDIVLNCFLFQVFHLCSHS